MKRKHLFKIIALISMFSFILIQSATFTKVLATNTYQETMEQKMENQQNAVTAGNLISSYFYKENTIAYPTYYAGNYIDEDNMLVICFSNAPTDAEDIFNRILGKYINYVKYVNMQYSTEELNEYGRRYWDYLRENNCRVTEMYVDVPNNYISISVLEEDLELAQALTIQTMKQEEVIPIKFSVGSYVVTEATIEAGCLRKEISHGVKY